MKKILLIVTLLFTLPTVAQVGLTNDTTKSFWKNSPEYNPKRLRTIVIGESVVGVGALVALDQLWYQDYPRSNFHTYDDNGQWLQMDKAGHTLTAYYISTFGIEMLDWTGIDHNKAIWYGGLLGLTFQSGIEILDGFSDEWGFSWGDFAANTLGSGIAIGQELAWGEQRIIMKYSFHQTPYANIRPDVLGDGLIEESLKDYNGQTYWLSGNINSFTKSDNLPDWLNIAVGYGASGLITGSANDPKRYEIDPTGSYTRQRQFYLSLDIDLKRIKTKSKLLKAVFGVVNFIKIPAPTLEVKDDGTIRFYPIYF